VAGLCFQQFYPWTLDDCACLLSWIREVYVLACVVSFCDCCLAWPWAVWVAAVLTPLPGTPLRQCGQHINTEHCSQQQYLQHPVFKRMLCVVGQPGVGLHPFTPPMLCHPAGACRQACWWIPCCAGNLVLQRVGTGCTSCAVHCRHSCSAGPQSRESCSVASYDLGHVQMCSHVSAARWRFAHHPHSCTIKGFWAVCLQGRRQLGYGVGGYGMGGYGMAGCGMEGCVPAATVSAGDAL
jgi:hypothetical protein